MLISSENEMICFYFSNLIHIKKNTNVIVNEQDLNHWCLIFRTPLEFAEDHVQGAINLPVLNNEQRAEVGTLYSKDTLQVFHEIYNIDHSGNFFCASC